MIRFITFKPYTEYDGNGRRIVYSATLQTNEWIRENPDAVIISWQTTPILAENDLCITIQYEEESADEGKRTN
jgi:hypothetical protein